MTLVAVLGAGSWGTTLANLLAMKGDRVRIWAYEPEVVQAINREHQYPMFRCIPGCWRTAMPGKPWPMFP
jgi:glycerol-3-phosphate dehydrogenase